jgi:nucleoside-diphosphate kinase
MPALYPGGIFPPYMSSENERTLILVKPDGVARGLVGEVVRRFEARALKLAAMKLINAPRETVEKHYDEHRERPFFNDVVDYLCSGPIVAIALEGPNAVKAARAMMGATNPADAPSGTIRGDLALSIENNIVHGSADAESAAKELAIWFSDSEYV